MTPQVVFALLYRVSAVDESVKALTAAIKDLIAVLAEEAVLEAMHEKAEPGVTIH